MRKPKRLSIRLVVPGCEDGAILSLSEDDLCLVSQWSGLNDVAQVSHRLMDIGISVLSLVCSAQTGEAMRKLNEERR